ncbi:mediator of RNA polymerase II transcription subunit 14 [Dendrobium catenatum]|uniref:Mediator of RNA polymerase II transcription subunit 14 n=1 Tax=Dendrobium catenatum TaxID=906689 RepID=A0A2I0XAP4_9ASPA|nr:mediator of RNA polymerase II transcription subunit 14 [Dendrobium catenatum]PKU84972.1 Mediator of RNA polymerase II transcription subunit 14 [Dendrobium catenatum]
MAAELGQQTVEFSNLVRRAAEESYLSLKELVETHKSPQERSDSEKKIDLLKFIVKTRQRMLRLHVLSKWCLQVPLIQYCQQLSATLSSHDTCFTQTADSLFYMHDSLQQARAPIFDVPSAVEVLLTGGYNRLPKCIEDLGFQPALSDDLQKPALKKLEMVLRSKLLDASIPKEISEVKISNGTAVLIVDGEFKVFLTLGYRGHLSLWRILHLELLVGEKGDPIKLEETRRYVLGDDLERRMAVAEKPFMILYNILHELCVSLVMDTVLRQVKILRQGRWKDAIRFELISDGISGHGVNTSATQMAQDAELDSTTQKIPGLKIIYWLDSVRNAAISDSSSLPFIKIEPAQDLQIKCLHSTFVFDPVTDKEAELSLQLSCIDVEKLLLRAIACSRHTRLLDIQRELSKNVHICQSAADVILKREGDDSDPCSKKKDGGGPLVHEFCGDEVLQVRAYGSSYIKLRINIRNGRYLLYCSKNILATSALLECEEALNLGTVTATEVFISLRSKSILHLFASIGRSLGLKVYENCLASLKIPKSILHGSDLLLMGFPQSGNSYFLLMQLDKDFRPLFNLLETQPDTGGKSQSVSNINHVIRFNKIDIGQMQMVDDDLNLSLLNWEKISTLPNLATLNQLSKNALPELGLEHALQLPDCSQSSFSSIVDEVFESEKDVLGNHLSNQSFSSSYGVPSFSHLNSLSTFGQGTMVGVGTPKLDGGIQNSQSNTFNKVSSGLNGSFYLSGNAKGQLNSNSSAMFTSSMRNPPFQKLPSSKSEQDLSSLKSLYSTELSQFNALDEDQTKLINSSGSSLVANRAGTTVSRVSVPVSRMNGSKGSSYSHLVGHLGSTGSSSLTAAPSCQASESGASHAIGLRAISKPERTPHKRSLSEILTMIPSFKELEQDDRPWKRMRTLESTDSLGLSAFPSCRSGEHMYGSLLAEAIHGNAPSNIYVSVLLHVIRHCSLCIKHARLTSQMEALDIPYVEEVGLRASSLNLWFRLPLAQDGSWQHICLRLGKPGSMYWDVKIKDQHFQELWELCKGNNSTTWYPGVRIANASDVDSHIHYDPEGVVLGYKTVEADSIERLVSDLRRLSNARLFARGMRRLIGARADDKLDDLTASSDNNLQIQKAANEPVDKLTEQMRRIFKIEAVGLMSLWFSYGSVPFMAHFVVEWEAGREGCTMHVSPDHLWPHTKFLEDFINGGDVASFLDCIRLTAGPLLALAAAIPPARMSGPVSTGPSPISKQGSYLPSQGFLPNSSISNVVMPLSPAASTGTSVAPPLSSHNIHNAATLSAAGRCVSGIVPSSLLPIDVSVVLRGPYWIRIIYRKRFSVDMRCFAGDQVWLQPATPPKGGPASGGSLPCPQFRPFIMEHVAQGLNALEPNFPAVTHTGGHLSLSNSLQSSAAQPLSANGNRSSPVTGVGMPRPVTIIGNQMSGNLSRVSNSMLPTSGMPSGISGVPMRIAQGTGVPVHVRGELNTAFIGLGDDGGYGGGWVPLAALKKVLRGILKYLGVLWLFAQLPNLLKEILGSILKDNEGALLNLEQEQPALRFFVGGYVFAVSVHRVQLLLQVLSVKRFHHQQQQQTQTSAQEEFSASETNEICDYFSRRVASEPYDASRVASFITLLTLPISVLREFLKLIAWKKGLSQVHGGEIASAQRARIELCLENHLGSSFNESSENSSVSKSNIHHDRAHSAVDFALTFVLDPVHIPYVNAAGGAAWLPYCVSVRLKYSFGENPHISFLRMDGSHGGRACWSRVDDWEKCKQKLAKAVDYANGNSLGDISQGRLRLVAESLQRTLQASLQQLRDGSVSSGSSLT